MMMSDVLNRWRPLAAVLMASLIVWGVTSPAGAWQDDPPEAAEEAAAEEAAPAAAPASQAEEEELPTAATESFLGMLVRANGWIFGPIFLGLSFVLVALLLINGMQLRRDNFIPSAFIEEFEQKLAGKDYQGAYEMARTDDSFLAKVLAAGLARLNRGYSEAVEGMQEVGEEENMIVEHRLGYFALIAAVSPMLGLLGTVSGMVASFQVIAQSTTQPKPAELADGISTALVTTLEGLIIAIPAMIAYTLLRNRASRYVLEIGMVSEGLMQRFSSVGKGKAGGAAPAAAPAAPQQQA